MGKKLRDGKVFTVPNIISMVRLVLLPVIIALYLYGLYIPSGIILAFSAVSDVADGIIARKFNMISDLGKILDPIADKLTQAAVLVCVAMTKHEIIPLMVLFLFIQIAMGLAGLHTMNRTEEVISAKWYGKANTVLLETSIIAVILFNIKGLPLYIINGVCSAFGLFTFCMYMLHYKRMIAAADRERAAREDGK